MSGMRWNRATASGIAFPFSGTLYAQQVAFLTEALWRLASQAQPQRKFALVFVEIGAGQKIGNGLAVCRPHQ